MIQKLLMVLTAFALSVPLSLSGYQNGDAIYAKTTDSLAASEQAIYLNNEEISEYPYSFKDLENGKTYALKSGDNTYFLHIDDTAPVITTNIDSLDKDVYKSLNVRVSITGADTQKILLKSKDVPAGKEMDPEFSVTEDGKYTLSVTAEDKAGNKAEKNIEFSISNEGPKVEISGADKEIKNEAYTLKAKVTSSFKTENEATLDGEKVSDNIFGEGITVSDEGKHTLVVTSKDSAGNETNVTKSFEIDYTKPEVEISLAPGIYRSADIDVSIRGADTQKILLNGEEKENSFSVTEDGKYKLTVEASDKAGNKETKEVDFRIYNVSPVITVSGLDKTLQNRDYTLRVSTSSDVETTTTVLLDGKQAGLNNTVTEEGTHSIVVQAVDAIGNSSEYSQTFEIDKTDPTLKIEGIGNGDYVNKDIDLDVETEDKNLKALTVTLNGRKLHDSSEGSYSGQINEDGDYRLVVRTEDNAGNSVEKTYSFTLDKKAPSITANDVRYIRDLTEVIGHADDTNLKSFSVQAVCGSKVFGPYANGTEDIQLHSDDPEGAENDRWTFTFTAEDKSGNKEVLVKDVIRDTVDPKIDISCPSGHVNTNADVKAVITDKNEKKSVMTVTKDGHKYGTSIEGTGTLSTTLTEEGEYEIEVNSEDNTGNSSRETASFIIDKTAPVASLTASSGHNRKAVPVELESNEDGETVLKITLDDKKIYDKTVKGPQEFSQLRKNGVYKVNAYAIDLAGNVSKEKSAKFIVDTVAPDLSLSGAKAGSFNPKPVTIRAASKERFYKTCSVTVSGYIEKGGKVRIPFKSTSKNTVVNKTFSTNGTYHLKMSAKDAAGNSSSVKELIFTVDTKKPVIKLEVPTDGRYDAKIAPKVTITDDYFKDKKITLSKGTNLNFKDSFGKTGGTRTYSDFVRLKDNDGRYTMTVTATDKAGNTSTESKQFIVNRFGSRFKTLKYPSAYAQAADSDVVLRETNVSGIKSYKCEVYKDSIPSDAKDVKTRTDKDVTIYTVPSSNFAEDGVYKVYITSKDNSENTSKSKGDFSFTVDSTAPVITYTGVEPDHIYKETEVKMYVSATDTLSKKVKLSVSIDGRKADIQTDGSGNYVSIGNGLNRNIVIEAEDKAGNASTQEIPNVTVSTSSLAYFKVHKKLTFGLALLLAAGCGGLGFLVANRKKGRKEKDQGDDIVF